MAGDHDRALRLEHCSEAGVAGRPGSGQDHRPETVERLLVEGLLPLRDGHQGKVPLFGRWILLHHHRRVHRSENISVDAERNKPIALGDIFERFGHVVGSRLAMPGDEINHRCSPPSANRTDYGC